MGVCARQCVFLCVLSIYSIYAFIEFYRFKMGF